MLAQDRAKELNRPLIVIGDPHNGFACSLFGKAYEGGDKMIDLFPCPKCMDDPNTIKGDLIEELESLEPDSCVIYTSCVLEYVPQIDEAIEQIERVAGSYENIFCVHVQPYCLTAYIYPYKFITKHSALLHVISKAPPYNKEFIYKSL
jgi:hypothetical protein